MRKGGTLKGKKEVFALYVLQFKRVKRSQKLIHPKSIQNGPLGRHLVYILRLGCFRKCEFLMIVGVGKVLWEKKTYKMYPKS